MLKNSGTRHRRTPCTFNHRTFNRHSLNQCLGIVTGVLGGVLCNAIVWSVVAATPSSASAQSAPSTPNTATRRTDSDKSRADLRKDIQAQQDTLRKDFREKREEMIKKLREAKKAGDSEQVRQLVNNFRSEVREQITSARQQTKEKLDKFVAEGKITKEEIANFRKNQIARKNSWKQLQKRYRRKHWPGWLRVELQTNLRRRARLQRIREVAQQNQDQLAVARVNQLMAKETRRHQLRMQQLEKLEPEIQPQTDSAPSQTQEQQ